ncbi:MAG TPA: glycosyltransferase family 2 protein [Candidatus Binataceae bacterium]|nr:glycosyltransferase family 2 protein [Candidatus Binataceae bacterium]
MATRLPGISVFLPSHNEEGNVERVVTDMCAALPKIAEDYEVIVVDDGSKDRTGEIADRLAASNPHVKVVHHQINRGYGGAVISGIQASRMPYVVLCDGDGQFDPADIGLLAEKVPVYDVVVGRRTHRADPMMRRLNGRAWTVLIWLLLKVRIHDLDCGLKLFKHEMLDGLDLRSQGAMITAELMAQLVGRGARITEVPVRHLPRIAGEQTGANMRVILKAFRDLFKLYGRLREARKRGEAIVDK